MSAPIGLNRRRPPRFRGRLCSTALACTLAAAADGQQSPPADTSSATPAGAWLVRALDRLDVEHHWLRSHDHVAWRTGLPLLEEHGKKLTPLAEDETHCSAFAAAAADSLGIYLLHPPEHSHVLLANAQFDWLSSDAGRMAGWLPVTSPLEAQQRANRGEFVVAAFKSPVAKTPGHIAVVRPAAESAGRIERDGPQITQAGFANYRSIDLKTGFARHRGAWLPGGRGAVKFFAHAVKVETLAGE